MNIHIYIYIHEYAPQEQEFKIRKLKEKMENIAPTKKNKAPRPLGDTGRAAGLSSRIDLRRPRPRSRELSGGGAVDGGRRVATRRSEALVRICRTQDADCLVGKEADGVAVSRGAEPFPLQAYCRMVFCLGVRACCTTEHPPSYPSINVSVHPSVHPSLHP